ncbi:MAG: DUF4276 family protein [Magnetococcus sp. DMHC-8]
MHFEILVEGQADLVTLSILMPRLVGPYRCPHTWKIHKHRGIGKLPAEGDVGRVNRKDHSLLHTLPGKLKVYGERMREDEMVVVLVDLDDRPDCRIFKQELVALLRHCPKQPRCLFRIAVQELEAWFLGDTAALYSAYPHARRAPLDACAQGSQSGTWESLADIIHPGSWSALLAAGGRRGKRSCLVMDRKQEWAKRIAPHMDVECNRSPSFQCFRDGLRRFVPPV